MKVWKFIGIDAYANLGDVSSSWHEIFMDLNMFVVSLGLVL